MFSISETVVLPTAAYKDVLAKPEAYCFSIAALTERTLRALCNCFLLFPVTTMRSFAILLATLLIGHAAGNVLSSRSAAHSLVRRQLDDGSSSGIPAQCQDACSSFTSDFETCSAEPIPDSCACTSSFAQAYIACLNCEINLDPSLESQDTQALDDFSNTCQQEGFDVGQLSLSGSSGSADNNKGGNGQTSLKNGATGHSLLSGASLAGLAAICVVLQECIRR
ncbi:hypothetical protein CERSUDRAFT_119979 [Gelatoporia subvermispora B]|uniref:Uncharacterized protein n=1 Tax=Ceriporiopsis subvermispora (strain B) TaxID=914234 RepID=M2QXA5_CERS8|nr:hypothetical protein CERSUDRAFT_119979 [Gelatoporia subvermispora B]